MHSRDIASGCALLPAWAAGAWLAVGQAPFTFPLCPWACPLAAGSTVAFLPSPWPVCDPGHVPSGGRQGTAPAPPNSTARLCTHIPHPFPRHTPQKWFLLECLDSGWVCWGEKPPSSPWRANFLPTHPVSSALPAPEPCCKPRLLVSLLVSSGIKLIVIDIPIDCINATRHQVTCTHSLSFLFFLMQETLPSL